MKLITKPFFARLAICLFAGLISFPPFAQNIDSIPPKLGLLDNAARPNKTRMAVLGTTLGVSYVGSMAGLYYLWYAGYPQSRFHLFNDNKEWFQMDKGGHLVNSYIIGKFGMDIMRYAGIDRKKSIWIGGSFGLIFLTTIEVFDGLSAEWGFSWGDMIANTLGTSSVIAQELLWNEQRFTWKLFYHNSNTAQFRPDLLGSNFSERLVKDYNGHSYWLSANVYSFLPKESKFPKWISVAGGIGASGMLGAFRNSGMDGAGNPLPQMDRFRQYYFSIDIDLTRIKTRSKLLKAMFSAVRLIKIPSPTLEINSTARGKMRVYAFYPFF